MNRQVSTLIFLALLAVLLFMLYELSQPQTVGLVSVTTQSQSQSGSNPLKPDVFAPKKDLDAVDLSKNTLRYIPDADAEITEAKLNVPDGLQITNLNPVDNPINFNDALVDAEEKFYRYSEELNVKCTKQRRLGRKTDGGWNICTAGPYEPKKDDCLIYSFGINNIWDFDDAAASTYGCQVRSFDPSMKVEDHKRGTHISFYKTGLDGTNQLSLNGWKMRTLKRLLEELGDSDKTIDMIKFDVEYSEWEAFEAMLVDGSLHKVKQIAFEMHTHDFFAVRGGVKSATTDFARYWRSLKTLELLGFKKWHIVPNDSSYYKSLISGKKRTCCYDLYYINMNFIKKEP